MTIKKILWLFFVPALWLTACSNTKKITTNISVKDTAAKSIMVPITAPQTSLVDTPKVDLGKLIDEKIKTNKINCDWFSAKLKVNYDDYAGNSDDATVYVHLKKDSIIWISLTGTLGIEGFRILITQDSVLIMNKLKKQIQKRKINFLEDVTQMPFNFATLQDFILGNLIFWGNNIDSYKPVDGNLQAVSIGAFFKHIVTIDTATNQILHSQLIAVDPNNNKTCDILFSAYEKNNGKNFSISRDVKLTGQSKLDLQLRFKQYSFNESQTFPFAIPKSYKAL